MPFYFRRLYSILPLITREMVRRKTRSGPLHDRQQLMAALADYEAGAACHLADDERFALIAGLKDRIAKLDALAGVES